jgi:hypothetical protein
VTTVTTLTRRLEIRAGALPAEGAFGDTLMPRLDVVFAALSAIHDLLPKYAPREVVEVDAGDEAAFWQAWTLV